MIRHVLFWVLSLCLAGAAAAEAPVAREARLAGDKLRTRFVVDLSRPVEIAVFSLADPYRVVVDMPEVTFQLPAAGGEGRGLVSAFRFGLLGPGKSRLVLDTTDPVWVDKSFVLPPENGQPARLVLDLVRTDRDAYLRTLAAETPKRQRPQSAGPEAVAAPTAGAVVVIDPGHGGIDPGTTGHGGVPEKAIMLDFAKSLKAKLERGGRTRVVLTREDDRFVSLPERVRIARENHAALFLSVHADSIGASDVRGATLYVLSDTASDAEAAALADKENRADVVAGLDVAEGADMVNDILFDLTQRETKNLSMSVARAIVEDLRGAAKLNKNFLRAAGFRVLRAPDVPSVLLELGYLSSAADEKLLTSAEWRERTAEAVARSIEALVGVRTARALSPGG